MPAQLKVLIPVECSGYTGQRDAYESSTCDHEVAWTDDGRTSLTCTQAGSCRPAVTFDMNDLNLAIKMIEEAELNG